MTTIEQAIKEAVEKGGYKSTSAKNYLRPQYRHADWLPDAENHCFLDPFFWQALGKVRRWNRVWRLQFCEETADGDSPDGMNRIHEWQHHWHRFIDHLAEEKDAESFFANLT